MALKEYQKKRDFTVTREPKGAPAKRGKGGNSFVIQKHAATRLHYDFRLEMDGVLKSWAVTRGPSLVPGEKRLAVHVEDHPLEYGSFEGTIPKGEYGGGTVIIWDRGEWFPVNDAHKGYAKGHLEFELKGEKLSGRWHLVRMARKPREKRENWLLIKGEDEAAREEGDPDILQELPQSVATGRDIDAVSGEEPGWSSKTGRIDKTKAVRSKPKKSEPQPLPASDAPALEPQKVKGAKNASLPAFVEPALATLAAAPPAGDKWLHEIKFDGYRIQARIEAGRVKLLTRSGLDWTGKFGKQLVRELAALPVGLALIDGEIVVENDAGASDFSALQADLSEGRTDRFVFYCFDLLHLDGHDLQAAPLIERKKLLESIIPPTGSIRYSGHFLEDGDLVLNHACRLSLEGIVSKLANGPYRSGRGKSWIKSKCSARQEFVIGGYVLSTVSKKAVGSLVLGQYEDGQLRYTGRVGTGFTAKVAEDLFDRLEKIRDKESPFAGKLTTQEARQVRFVRPELVAEVEFRAWTADGLLRHASFRGIREDKPAKEVVREQAKGKTQGDTKGDRPPKRTVTLTHPDRLYWPQDGVTKGGLADYYAEVWRRIAPFITGRPLALLRGPGGITGEMFFQKHAWKGLNKNIVLVNDPADPEEPLIAINDLDGLMGLVQSGVLEIHPWGSTLNDWEHPDMIIMDLDPGEGVEWKSVIAAAFDVKERLERAGLAAFLKTSGGKGLHVVSPLKPKADWAQAKEFTKAMADEMAAEKPDSYVSTIAKAKRTGKILVDYLRNQRGATAVAAYSTRARPGASVSMPLSWDEIGPDIGPAHFNVYNTPQRLAAQKSDPWEGFRAAAKPLPVKSAKSGKARG
jgi:bifunctional non-homologous end joining protein LigD